MSKPVFLDNVAHHDLKVITGYAAPFGDSVNQAIVFPTEFLELQREYAIFFRRTEEGWQSVVLLGLDTDENLYLDGDSWNARYVPALHQRGPCMIGYRDIEVDGDLRREPIIAVDMEHPRVSRTRGMPLFLPHGGNAPLLEHFAKVLQTLQIGEEASSGMFAAFEAAGLIVPVSIDLRLDESTLYVVPDLFTISAEALAGLKGGELERLNAPGYLVLAHYVLASVSNVNRLIELKNRRRTA